MWHFVHVTTHKLFVINIHLLGLGACLGIY
jgi:hypothetical protein